MKTSYLLMFLLLASVLTCGIKQSAGAETETNRTPGEAIPQTKADDAPDADLAARAQGGDREAQYDLGVMYLTGKGAGKDPEKAVRWLRLAAEQGHASAQYSLGVRYEKGEGVAPDGREAIKWLKRAAEQGHLLAQYSLGLRYAGGEEAVRDYAQAAKWFRKAANRGVVAAQYSLALRYVEGTGVPRDYVEAYKWFSLAEKGGKEAAGRGRENIEKKGLLSAEELAEARTRAEEFVPQRPSQ